MQAIFFYLGKFLKKLADNHCFLITKGSISYMEYEFDTTFYRGCGLTWNCTEERYRLPRQSQSNEVTYHNVHWHPFGPLRVVIIITTINVSVIHLINCVIILSTLPKKVKTLYLHFRFHANYSPLPWKIPEEIISKLSMLFHGLTQYLPYQTHVHTSFCHSGGLTKNLTFTGSIYYVLYLQILRFYLIQQHQ